MANQGVSGQIFDERGIGIPGLKVVVWDHDVLFSDQLLGQAVTDPAGKYQVNYAAGSYGLESAPDLLLRVFDSAERCLHESEVEENVTALVFVWRTIQLDTSDVLGWFVRGLLDPGNVVRDGNTVELLIDNQDAWEALTAAIEGATTSVALMPFAFEVPSFEADASKIVPTVVTRFAQPPESGRITETRLERVLLDVSRRRPPVHVHVLMHKNIPVDSAGAVTKYFKEAPLHNVEVRTFETPSPMQMTHAKIVIVDSNVAFLLGSPLLQDYYDSFTHEVDDARRGLGGVPNLPVHDVSARITGPAVVDLTRFFLTHWNQGVGNGPDLRPGAAPGPTGTLRAQIVRTLPRAQLPDLPEGERTILEAYLRAIAHAERFIYLENQYFVNFEVCRALAARLKAKPGLQLILLANHKADVPFYSTYRLLPVPGWTLLGFVLALLDFFLDARQSLRVQELIRALQVPAFERQVGVFTLWTHEPRQAPRAKPRIMPNYLHSKLAIIDDAWMTVGSANLDDYSLEGNSEANLVVAPAQPVPLVPTTWQPMPAIIKARQQLWAEHLGLRGALQQPDPDHPSLAGNQDWLKLWNEAAQRKLEGLKNTPQAPDQARVLEFPRDGTNVPLGVANPSDYLSELGLTGAQLDKLQLVTEIRLFDFKDHKWR